jgi:hypothetical protein
MTTKNLFPSLLLGLGLTAALVSGCKKDDDEKTPSTPSQSNTQKLCGKNWKMTAFTMSPGFMGFTDVYSAMDACEKDNIFKFNTNGSCTEDEGATKCDPSDPQTENGTWAWSDNETKINLLVGGAPSAPMNVEVNSGTMLKVNFTETDSTIGTQKFTITFTKQ